jgi:nicotinate-nucleotide--dimethylbenzimidazole phosphoribosyltransferase
MEHTVPLDFVIPPLDTTLKSALQTKINQKTKPLGALGQLETLALQIGLCQNSLTPCLTNPSILIFAGDHGIVASGVSAYPQTVTAQMVANFLAGGAAISVFAKQHGLHLLVVDAGVNADLNSHPQLINAKIDKGTQNFLTQSAMSLDDCLKAIQTGADLVNQQRALGCNCIGFGEMGIGNTSSAALLMHTLTGLPLAQCVGRGTGLNDEQLAHKVAVLQRALQQNGGWGELCEPQQTSHGFVGVRPSSQPTPLQALATFGGFEIAMMVGAYLQAAQSGMIILVDGFIASSALLVASCLYPAVLDYCVFSHVSNEQGHQSLLKHFNATAILNLNLRLGEGSGIALAYPLLQSAVLFLNDMASFAEAGVDVK